MFASHFHLVNEPTAIQNKATENHDHFSKRPYEIFEEDGCGEPETTPANLTTLNTPQTLWKW